MSALKALQIASKSRISVKNARSMLFAKCHYHVFWLFQHAISAFAGLALYTGPNYNALPPNNIGICFREL